VTTIRKFELAAASVLLCLLAWAAPIAAQQYGQA
jgi:hypothetical protein